MCNILRKIWGALARRKTSVYSGGSGLPLPRCLTVVDVTCLGLATTLGTGVYVLIAEAAREFAGPSVVLSILVASVTSCLGGLCYSEVATRFPKGGSAYAYTYATTGELCAFLVGWGMVLEYSLGTALAAKACTQYLDVAINGSLSRALEQSLRQLDIPGLDKYFDLPSIVVTISVSLLLALTVKFLCYVNNALVIINLLVISGMVLVGSFNMDAENWTAGAGFFPNGASGVFSAAALVYFGYVGYDIMAICTSEMTHRSRILPTAVSLVFLVGLLTSFTISAAITLLIPSSLLESRGSLMQAFMVRGVIGMEYFAVVGATAGFLSATAASLFAHARLLQSLAADGLLFKFLSRRDSPLDGGCGCAATLTSCIVSSLLALLCDTRTLVHVTGMGTLSACTSVAVAVLCLRYGVAERLPLELGELSRESTANLSQAGLYNSELCLNQVDAETQTVSQPCQFRKDSNSNPNCLLHQSEATTNPPDGRIDYGSIRRRSLSVDFVNESFVTCLSELSPHWSKRTPSQKSAATAAGLVAAMMLTMLLMGVMTLHVPRLVSGSRWWTELIACGLFLAVLVCVALVCRQPRHRPKLHNHVPCVPLLPLCAIWMDVHLMVGLPYTAWIVFLVWALIGALLYLAYGLWHSIERQTEDQQDVNLLNVTEDYDNGDRDFSHQEVLVETF